MIILLALFSVGFDNITPQTESIRKILYEGKFGCGILVDLQRACRTVNHI